MFPRVVLLGGGGAYQGALGALEVPSKGTVELFTPLHSCVLLPDHKGDGLSLSQNLSTVAKSKGTNTSWTGTSKLVSQNEACVYLDSFLETMSQFPLTSLALAERGQFKGLLVPG